MNDCPDRKMTPYDAGEKPARMNKRWMLVFALIFLTGVAVRLVHITKESVWWDEFATVAFLKPPPEYEASPEYNRWNQVVMRQNSPTLGAFLRQNKDLDPAAMPMYLAVEYYWNRFVSASTLSLRLLSVLFGLITLPLLFLVGAHLFGRNVGLIAMFCLALSPIHIQFSREIRMYGLMTLLAVIAVYVFCHIIEGGGKKWWGLYGIVMLALSWTHPFALLLPVSMGVFWLLSRPRDIVRLFKWGLLTALVALPAALWVLTIQFWGQDSTESWMRAPNLIELINDIFADDAIGATYQLNATPDAWSAIVGGSAAQWIISWRWAVGRAAVAVSIGCLVWLFVLPLLKRGQKEVLVGHSPAVVVAPAWSFFLGLWLILPPVMLWMLSVLWRPCHQPRYTVHSSLALYLAIGCAVMALPRRWLRALCITIIVLFYGYQQMLMLGQPQHPDWLGASRTIISEARTDDLILSHNWLWKRVFAYNLGPVPNIVCYGSTHEILAEKAAFFLDPAFPAHEPNAELRTVWTVVQTDYFTEGTIKPLEEALAARGLNYECQIFGGIQRVILYRIRRGEHTEPYTPRVSADSDAPKEFADLAMEFWRAQEYEKAIAAADNALKINPRYARAWSYMGMSYKELNRDTEALEAFQQALAIDPSDYPWTLSNHAELLIQAGRYQEAVTVAEKALEALPGDPWCLALLGRAFYYLEDYEQAQKVLRQAIQGEYNDMRIRQWLEETEKAITGSKPHE